MGFIIKKKRSACFHADINITGVIKIVKIDFCIFLLTLSFL